MTESRRGALLSNLEYRRRALLYDVKRIEEVAAQEARKREWDLKEIEDLVQGLLAAAEPELPDTPADKRQVAHLRAGEVGAAAHHVEQVVEKVVPLSGDGDTRGELDAEPRRPPAPSENAQALAEPLREQAAERPESEPNHDYQSDKITTM